MNVLVVDNDKITRDHAVTGLENFGSFNVDVALGSSALEMICQKEYAFAVIGMNPGDTESQDILHNIKGRANKMDIIVMAGDIIAKNLSREKINSNIFAFINKPVDPYAFHQTINRLKQRILERK